MRRTPRARQGMLLGRGGAVRASAPFWRRVRRAVAHRRFSGNPRRSLFGGWALPERDVFGGGIGRKIRAGRSTVNDFRFGRTRVKRQSFCTEWKNGFFGDRTSANSRIMVPHRAERVWGVVHIGSKIRAGKVTVNYFGSGGPASIYACQSSPSEIMACLGE